MNDILSTRLDMIQTQLERVQDFAGLDDLRVKDLDTLIALLDGSVKQYARDIDDTLGRVRKGLEDLRMLIVESTADDSLCDECTGLLETVQEAVATTNKLQTDVITAIGTARAGRKRRPSVQTSDPWKITREAFDKTSNTISGEVKGVRDLVTAAGQSETAGKHEEAAGLWNSAWKKYADFVYAPGRMLFGDYSDFLLGLATRDSLLDEGVCQLADDLIKQWNPGVSLTIPAKYVALESTLARIVRLSFQDWSIWALPLAAREVGYVVNARENASDRLAGFIREKMVDGQIEAHLRDYLADVFGTYVMGPAYCYAAIYMRFDPLLAYEPLDDHPPDAMRAEVIFDALDWMSRAKLENDPYQSILEELRSQWQVVLAQAIVPARRALPMAGSFTTLVEELAQIVYSERQAMFSATAWGRAKQMRNDFLEGRNSAQPQDDLRSVLNAAWLARVQKPSQSKLIESLARQAFDSVMKRKPAPAGSLATLGEAQWSQRKQPLASVAGSRGG
jgi:hypothetical protein